MGILLSIEVSFCVWNCFVDVRLDVDSVVDYDFGGIFVGLDNLLVLIEDLREIGIDW